MGQGASSIFQTVSEIHLLRHFRLASMRLDCGEGEGERSRLTKEMVLLLRTAIDPEFFAFAWSAALEDQATAQRTEELDFVIALGLVLPRGRPVEEAPEMSQGGDGLYERIVTKAKLDELAQAYPEIFSDRQTTAGPMTLKELMSALEEMKTVGDGEGAAATCLSAALNAVMPGGITGEHFSEALALHSALRAISLQDLHSFVATSHTVGQATASLVQSLAGQDGLDGQAAEEIATGRGASELLYRISAGGALLRWFRELTEEERAVVLEGSLDLPLDERSVKDAVACALGLPGDAEQGWDRATDGAEAYRQYGEARAAVWAYEALLEDRRMEGRRRAVALNRLAVLDRGARRTRRALTGFLEANILWEELGERWEEGVTAAFIAEAYHKLGKDRQARHYLDSSLQLLRSCDETPERMARGMFYIAGSANTLGDLVVERSALEEGAQQAGKMEDPDLFIELNERLLRLPP